MILHGDCLERLKELQDNSVDSVVTDPPYGWRFMGKAWDGADIEKTFARDKTLETDNKTTLGMAAGKYNQSLIANQSFQAFSESYAKELLRVLKPGGHVLIFCGPRTYHRMASGVEDAGFEIRDQLQWIFGSGFPKSHDISKAIDKQKGAKREVIGVDETKLRPNKERFAKVVGENTGHGLAGVKDNGATITKPATPEAYRYKGWGTALKPANEPIVLARKPLEKGLTVAENMLKWGVGGLNIDESRIGFENGDTTASANSAGMGAGRETANLGAPAFGNKLGGVIAAPHAQGRWPANLLLDESAAEMLDEQSGASKSTTHSRGNGIGDGFHGSRNEHFGIRGVSDSGGASRFFYVAKASKRERNAGLEGMPEKELRSAGGTTSSGKPTMEGRDRFGSVQSNNHPTVKPIKLMEYLCKLITPPGGVILDPFCGSGSTGVAAFKNGFKFIGIEMNEEYVAIARKRIESSRSS